MKKDLAVIPSTRRTKIGLKEWQLFVCLVERSRLDAIEALIQEVGMTDVEAEDFRRYYGLDKRGPDPVRKMT